MQYIQGKNREQLVLFPTSLDDLIDEDKEARFIDLFVESLDLEKMGFSHRDGFPEVFREENGRPAYHPKDLLKLFLYGYLNSIRSSRKLEQASKINIEVIWLLKGLSPDHNTISNFRRDNSKAIKKTFRATVQIAKHFDLIRGKLIAGDSTKLRAQNSKKTISIKRQWGFNYIMTKKTKHRAEADVGLIFIAYNLRRLISIIGTEMLMEYLERFIFIISCYLHQYRLKISQYEQLRFFIGFSIFLYLEKPNALRTYKLFREAY